ncbi:MAG TPA: molybdopterin cofactor-binding domain-containing protein [Acidobacteriaceae bacterium]
MSIEMTEEAVPVGQPTGVTRRQFIVTGTSGFMLQFCLPGVSRAAAALGAPAPVKMNSYIVIHANSTATIYFGGCELGQGAMSGLAQLAAEELMLDWSQVVTQTVLPDSISYITGGSSAIRTNYLPVRQAGAAVRTMLIEAAAARWKVPVAQCTASNGEVTDTVSKRILSYGNLAAAAAKLSPPSKPFLVADAKLRLIGKSMPRLDLPDKVNGRAIYGIDVRVPNMLYAAVKHCPSLGGTLASTPGNPGGGVVAVVPLGNAVAMVAGTTWDAMSAFDEMEISWNIPASSKAIDSTVFSTEATTIMAQGPVVPAEVIGNAASAMAGAAKVHDATYSFPYLAHACMEVLNCTVSITAAGCEIWAPTQAAAWVQGTAAALTGLPLSKITVHTTLMGGGLGRKIEQDYIAQAVKVAMAVKAPVKLMWPREEDFGKDMYRPMVLSHVKAGLDAYHRVVAWENRIVSPSIQAQRGWISAGSEDGQSTEGATSLPYAMATRLVQYGAHPSPVPIGFWRSVGHSYNAFVVETFIDELAMIAGVDPYTYRRGLLINNERYLAVLDAAATLGDYTSPVPSGHARGIAIAEAFGTVVAEVVEIANATSTSVDVLTVACAVDCGRVINPDSVTAQMQGGIVHGLSAALWGHITFANGVASVSNFDNYRLVRMPEMPAVSVHLLPSTNPPTGAGEPGVPPLAPALANAYFKLTGQRVRSLPFFPTQSTMGDD